MSARGGEEPLRGAEIIYGLFHKYATKSSGALYGVVGIPYYRMKQLMVDMDLLEGVPAALVDVYVREHMQRADQDGTGIVSAQDFVVWLLSEVAALVPIRESFDAVTGLRPLYNQYHAVLLGDVGFAEGTRRPATGMLSWQFLRLVEQYGISASSESARHAFKAARASFGAFRGASQTSSEGQAADPTSGGRLQFAAFVRALGLLAERKMSSHDVPLYQVVSCGQPPPTADPRLASAPLPPAAAQLGLGSALEGPASKEAYACAHCGQQHSRWRLDDWLKLEEVVRVLGIPQPVRDYLPDLPLVNARNLRAVFHRYNARYNKGKMPPMSYKLPIKTPAAAATDADYSAAGSGATGGPAAYGACCCLYRSLSVMEMPAWLRLCGDCETLRVEAGAHGGSLNPGRLEAAFVAAASVGGVYLADDSAGIHDVPVPPDSSGQAKLTLQRNRLGTVVGSDGRAAGDGPAPKRSSAAYAAAGEPPGSGGGPPTISPALHEVKGPASAAAWLASARSLPYGPASGAAAGLPPAGAGGQHRAARLALTFPQFLEALRLVAEEVGGHPTTTLLSEQILIRMIHDIVREGCPRPDPTTLTGSNQIRRQLANDRARELGLGPVASAPAAGLAPEPSSATSATTSTKYTYDEFTPPDSNLYTSASSSRVGSVTGPPVRPPSAKLSRSQSSNATAAAPIGAGAMRPPLPWQVGAGGAASGSGGMPAPPSAWARPRASAAGPMSPPQAERSSASALSAAGSTTSASRPRPSSAPRVRASSSDGAAPAAAAGPPLPLPPRAHVRRDDPPSVPPPPSAQASEPALRPRSAPRRSRSVSGASDLLGSSVSASVLEGQGSSLTALGSVSARERHRDPERDRDRDRERDRDKDRDRERDRDGGSTKLAFGRSVPRPDVPRLNLGALTGTSEAPHAGSAKSLTSPTAASAASASGPLRRTGSGRRGRSEGSGGDSGAGGSLRPEAEPGYPGHHTHHTHHHHHHGQAHLSPDEPTIPEEGDPAGDSSQRRRHHHRHRDREGASATPGGRDTPASDRVSSAASPAPGAGAAGGPVVKPRSRGTSPAPSARRRVSGNTGYVTPLPPGSSLRQRPSADAGSILAAGSPAPGAAGPSGGGAAASSRHSDAGSVPGSISGRRRRGQPPPMAPLDPGEAVAAAKAAAAAMDPRSADIDGKSLARAASGLRNTLLYLAANPYTDGMVPEDGEPPAVPPLPEREVSYAASETGSAAVLAWRRENAVATPVADTLYPIPITKEASTAFGEDLPSQRSWTSNRDRPTARPTAMPDPLADPIETASSARGGGAGRPPSASPVPSAVANFRATPKPTTPLDLVVFPPEAPATARAPSRAASIKSGRGPAPSISGASVRSARSTGGGGGGGSRRGGDGSDDGAASVSRYPVPSTSAYGEGPTIYPGAVGGGGGGVYGSPSSAGGAAAASDSLAVAPRATSLSSAGGATGPRYLAPTGNERPPPESYEGSVRSDQFFFPRSAASPAPAPA
ncbi:hypothetical protein HYH03_017499 [Edaphochlamys debaryana]|uniref:EF-hand domain-containing protein n=1 Tax=Edaphochlamys debaryana TaxID=47281 RepID=A0A835XP45_9CHLO|nr:hypothetical protein HYH03_017499 [Edaphochlamys debaryana]|eukprot:KAG2483619.1 hypothetical protein HYH03_017499 [Edaphochlamys debaryana]